MKRKITFFAAIVFMILFKFSTAQQWSPVGGPQGANVTGISSTSTHLVVASDNINNPGGIWLTPLAGGSWTNVAMNMANKRVASVGIHGEYLFVSNSDHYNESDGGIHRSSDNGTSWETVLPQGSQSFSCFLSLNNTIYTCTNSGWVYRSSDNGITWASSNSGLVAYSAISCILSMGDSIYIGTSKGVYLSTDGAVTWSAMNNGIPTNSNYGRITSMTSIGNTLYAATFRSGVFKSTNRGESWTQLNGGITSLSIFSIYAKDNWVFAANAQGVLRINNNETIWTIANQGLPGTRISVFYNQGSTLLAGGQTGLYQSTDNGENWTDANNGLAGHTIGNQYNPNNIMIEAGEYLIAGTSTGSIYRSADQGVTWQLASNGINTNTFISAIYYVNQTLFASYQFGPLYTSTDFGETWESKANPISAPYQIMVNNNRIWASYYELLYSDDFGENWNVEPSVPTEVMKMCMKNEDLFVMTLEPYTTNTTIYKSVNGTDPFVLTGQMTGVVFEHICALGDTLFAFANTAGVYKSTNDGLTWSPDGLSDKLIRNFSVIGNKLFARTRDQLFLRSNNGSWVNINADLPPVLDDHDWYNTGLMATENKLLAAVSSLSLYQINMSAFEIPLQPGPISGNTTPCIGSIVTYSVPNTPGVIYTWQFPSGWVIISGGNASSVNVSVGSSPGLVLVTPATLMGTGPAQYLIVMPVTCLEKTLNLSVFLEGLYNGSNRMREANGEAGPQFGEGIADEITVELHNAADYGIIEHTFNNVQLEVSGNTTITVPTELTGDYYLTIKHRNSVETVSALLVSFAGSTITYAFDAPEKAFGGNLLQMMDGTFVIYGGDVNQDGIIDSGDMIPVENDAATASSGYLYNDCNGDGLIDSSDMVIIENNAAMAIGVETP
jgi:photosystem II stability/assembly factor-like uncharacterized protein